MTNSIASAKCPSVLTSGKYGMSQHRSITDDSKEYIFVKLTDSAFRAIEEYQRNRQTKRSHSGQCAKIQFIGNAGVIQFPSHDGSSGPGDGRKFGFAIDDVEGSLECIQQTGVEFDVLGSLNHRMRIHANDDVYDTTRTKMAIAEETEKSKCIREIKPNQTDIGRKVKRPVSAASLQAYTNGSSSGNGTNSMSSNTINGSSSYLSNNSSNNNSRSKSSSTSTLNQHSPPAGGGLGLGSICNNGTSRLVLPSTNTKSSPNPSVSGTNGTIGNGNSNCGSRYGSPSNFHSSSSLPSMSSSTFASGGGGNSSNGTSLSSNSPPQKKALQGSGSNSRNLTANGSTKKTNGTTSTNTGKHMDVSRRKIRERLIHLLALKPFKKPELYSRLTNEGLAPKERQLISTILKDISTLSRDNTYNLRRSMWNDVDENWPFFSEQEIQLLKRRKPQNLTPPMSSDAASSTSGQSPTSSTHTGSPPPTNGLNGLNGLNGVGNGVGLKRASLEPDLYDGALTAGVQNKKQRISHYKKDAPSGLGMINGVTNGYGGAGAKTAVGLNGIGANAHNNRNNSLVAHSPHNSSHSYSNSHLLNSNTGGNDENSGNSDLSFNVLNNMDDFIQQHTGAGGDQTYVGRVKNNGKSSSSNGNSSCNSITTSSTKEKRNSSGSTSSSSGYCSSSSVSQRDRETAVIHAMRRNNSPTPYTNNFVPETKTNSNSSSGSNSRYQLQQQQHQRPQQQQMSSSPPSYSSNNGMPHSSISSSSIIPNKLNEDCSNRKSNTSVSSSSSSSRSRHHSSSSGRNNGGVVDSSRKHSRSPTPTQKHSSKHYNSNSHPLQHQQQQQKLISACSAAGATYNSNVRSPPQPTAMLSSHYQEEQQQQQQHPSPTQQIAAAASALTNHPSSNVGDGPRFDFSKYTPITSIEQRRKYKTEFEQNYDEYRKLLAQIESVGQRFRELAERLNRVQQGCPDYYNIKDQIVSEYNRIRKEEAINRDKQRFDYLHEKLAHIKQLVMDYDKKLTSGIATLTPKGQHQISTTTPVSGQQQHQQHQQQQHQQQQPQQSLYHNNTNGSTAHLSPMLQSSGESNHSPPLMIINGTDTENLTTNDSSSYSTKKSSKHHHKQQQYQRHQHLEKTTEYQQEHYQHEHYDPETIQEVDEEQHPHSYNATNWNKNLEHQSTNLEQEQQQEQNIASAEEEFAQMKPNHHHSTNTNNHDSDSDSDSSSSSSSNEDNSDDDNSDVSDDDENSDDDSNDDDDDGVDDDNQ